MKDVFISYKAEEFEEASWVKSVLEQNGISCWMAPMCIPGGSSYAVEIPQAIRGAKAFVLILSKKSQESRWVSREVDIAINEGKVVLPFMLENCALKDDFNFYLTNVQRYAAYENKVAAVEKMIREIKALLGITETVVADNIAPTAEAVGVPNKESLSGIEKGKIQTPADASVPASTEKNKLPFKWIAIIVAVVLAVIIGVVLIVSLSGGDKDENAGGTSITSSPIPENEEFEMSDDLFDFTFELLGEVYKLPCSYDKFVQNGWTISSTDCNSETLIAGNSYESFAMSKDGSKIFLEAYNLGGNAKKIAECKIGGIECEQNYITAFKMAKDISVDFTPEQLETAFGVPTSTNDGDGYKSFRYDGNSDDSYVRFFYDTSEKYSSVTLRNFVKSEDDNTKTDTTRPEYLSEYVAPRSLGTDIFAAVIDVEGDLYRVPCPVSELLDNGWTKARAPGSVVAGGSDSMTLQKGDKKLDVYIANFAEYQTTVENCVAYKIYVYDYEKASATLPGGSDGISIGAEKSYLESALPDGFEFYEGSSGYNYSYYEYGEREFDISIHVDKESQKVSSMSVSCETWD